MKNKVVLLSIFSFLFLISCNNAEKPPVKEIKKQTNLVHLTNAEFKKLVFDYTNEKEWNYKGDLPCVIDFYASWCGPCKRIAPTIESLSKKYDGKIRFYKIDVDAEEELAGAFGIQSIPTLLFVPLNSEPQVEYGALTEQHFEEIINSKLLK